MDDSIQRALRRGHTIDITTTGRRTGQPRRIEIVFHNIDGRIFITGSPSRRTRGWIHNLEADSHLTFHLKRTVRADLPATARVITDPAERLFVEVEPIEQVGEPLLQHLLAHIGPQRPL